MLIFEYQFRRFRVQGFDAAQNDTPLQLTRPLNLPLPRTRPRTLEQIVAPHCRLLDDV